MEARWAVFFDTLGCAWRYDQAGEWGLRNEEHYRPQFFLPRLDAYLEVQRPGDARTRSWDYYHPEIEEPIVYLAVGDLPDEQQLGSIGWWDPTRGRGVKRLTPGYEWEDWFSPAYWRVLQAIEIARSTEFGSGIYP